MGIKLFIKENMLKKRQKQDQDTIKIFLNNHVQVVTWEINLHIKYHILIILYSMIFQHIILKQNYLRIPKNQLLVVFHFPECLHIIICI